MSCPRLREGGEEKKKKRKEEKKSISGHKVQIMLHCFAKKKPSLVSKVQIVCLQFQIMGACFQAPCTAPRQRLMETYLGKT